MRQHLNLLPSISEALDVSYEKPLFPQPDVPDAGD
jgi:hypothetical protein